MGIGKSNTSTTRRSKNPAKNARRKATNRPSTRKIVRWNDNLDRKLLLAIQSACNILGVKLPWVEVAKIMGNDISDGAIVQHLAKMRSRMVQAGMDVPPPLRRGGTAASSMTVRPAANTAAGNKSKRKTRADSPESDNGSGSNNIREKDFEESESSDDDYIAAGSSFLKYPKDEDSENEEDMGENDGPDVFAQKPGTPTKVIKLRIPKEKLQQVSGVHSAIAEQAVIKSENLSIDRMRYFSDSNSSAGKMSETAENSRQDEMQFDGPENAQPSQVWVGHFPTDLTVPNPGQYFDWDAQDPASFPLSTFPGNSYSFPAVALPQSGHHVNPNPFVAPPTSVSPITASHGELMGGERLSWMSGERGPGFPAAMDSFSSFGSSSMGNMDDQDYQELLTLSNHGSFDGGFENLR